MELWPGVHGRESASELCEACASAVAWLRRTGQDKPRAGTGEFGANAGFFFERLSATLTMSIPGSRAPLARAASTQIGSAWERTECRHGRSAWESESVWKLARDSPPRR